MSAIEWTDATWNPVVGCTPVSTGCLNCYAAGMAVRQEAMGTAGYEAKRIDAGGRDVTGLPGLQDDGDRVVRIAEVRAGRAVFTGEVRCLPDRLGVPLAWKKPRMVFVNSMSDLFHEDVPFEFIDRVFAVMALCPRHTFQILTKRPWRMAAYFASFEQDVEIGGTHGMMRLGTAAGKLLDGPWIWGEGERHRMAIERFICDAYEEDVDDHSAKEVPWPLPNVWLGTSVEDQAAAEKRIPQLLRCPAAKLFLSLEPLVGPVDLDRIVLIPSDAPERGKPPVSFSCLRGWHGGADRPEPTKIDWVIVGGESGPKARACDVAWIWSVVEQCRAAGVACFVKQLGARVEELSGPLLGGQWPRDTRWQCANGREEPSNVHTECVVKLRDRKGGDMAEWPEDLRVREMPERGLKARPPVDGGGGVGGGGA